MKYYKTLNQYKASNLVYDVDNETAYSYVWYQLAKRINGIMVINYFNYSPTTIRHYYKIRKLFETLGIQYILIEAPRGLQSLSSSIDYYETQIKSLENKINKPRSREHTNCNREIEIRLLMEQILVVNGLMRATA